MLELVERARAARRESFVDSAFQSYSADARGYVYFFVDRPDSDERTLVRADQIAIEMYWRAPDETRQRIVGLRDEEVLPTNIRYHLDHLTVVQDDFADVIRLGDGDEVSAVVHPVAPLSGGAYDFRLADSLTIEFPGSGQEPVRVYEVRVRPKDLEAPGFLGSIFLDRATGAIVRMSFTFTPASYVDPYLDYIRISLDNSLWDGRYWLPYRQEAELRREIPQLDFLAGSVIRGRFEISGYDIDAELPESVFRTTRVSAVPTAERVAFPFERGLFDQIEEEGLAPTPSLEEVREQARQMVQERYLSGLSRLRLHVPSVSQAFRYDRAEGAFLGAGVLLRPSADLSLRGRVGYAFGAGHPAGAVSLSTSNGPSTPTFTAYANDLRDLGPLPGREGAFNTLAALLAHEDDLDPWYATGARATLPLATGDLALTGTLTLERQRSATLVVTGGDDPFRPVRPVEEGDLAAADLALAWSPPVGEWRLSARGRMADLDGARYGTVEGSAEWARAAAWRDLGLRATVRGGIVTESAPAQELFLLGGRGTLLGHDHRAFVGDRFWLADALVSRSLVAPWVGARAFAAAGWAGLGGRALPPGWPGEGDAGVRASVGGGLSLGWDVLHVDLGRGLGEGGSWQLFISLSRRFAGWL